MSWAHRGSNLALEDMLICVPDGAHYFPFDHHLASTQLVYPEGYDNHTVTDYGLYTGTNLCATLRRGEGRFGSAIAIEEATTNMLINVTFENTTSWTTRGSAGYSISVDKDATYNGLNSLKITSTSPGSSGNDFAGVMSNNAQVGVIYYYSFYAKALEETILRARTGYGDVQETVTITTEWKRHTIKLIGGTQAHASIFQWFDKATTVWINSPQVEQKAFPTSFVEGSRSEGVLIYPMVGNKQRGAVSLWITPQTYDEDSLPSRAWSARIDLGWGRNIDTGFGEGFVIQRYSDRIQLRAWDGISGTNVVNYMNITPFTPIHVVITWEGPLLSFYVDGEYIGSMEKEISLSDKLSLSGVLWGGSYNIGSALYDDLMISGGVLSPEQITAIYHSQRPLYSPNRIDHIVG